MANENQNTGPQSGVDPKSLRASLRDILEDQGDFNSLLKSAISDLQKMDNLYTKIEAKLSTLNKETINVKQINQELFRLRQKEYIETKKLEDLKKSADRSSLAALDLAKQRTNQLMQDAAILGEKVDYEETMLQYLKDTGNIEAISLYTAEKQLELAQKQTKQGEEFLKNEKSVSRQLGISGNLVKIFAEKLGVGEEAYSSMTIESRNLVKDQEKMNVIGRVLSRTFGSFKVAFVGLGSIIKSAFSSLLDPAALLGIGGLFLKGLKSAFDYILGIQDQTVKFARALNISTIEARKIKMEYASFSISSGDVLINTQKLVEAQMELTDVLGITNTLSAQNLATVSKLKDFAGLEADTRANLATTSLITGKSVEQTTKSVLAQVVGLKNATGIGFQYQKILKEAASQSGYLGLQFAKYPEKLTKSLLTTKALGLELKQLDSIADSFLDFESSISKEFEAQLITGKQINLAKARELFLNNDLAGAASEITRQVGTAEQFLNMNRIAAESLASAFGMSRDQLADMLKQQQALAAFGAKNTKELYAQVDAYRAQGKEKEAIAKLGSEEAYQSLVNASAQEKIAGFVDKIKQSLADFVERTGIIDKIENMIEFLSKPENIRAVIVQVRDMFASLVEVAATLASGIISTLDFFNAISDQKAASAKAFLSGAGARIRSLGGDFGAESVSDNVVRGASANFSYQGNQTTTTDKTPMVVEAHLKGPIQVVDMATNIQGRINRGVFPEYTNMY